MTVDFENIPFVGARWFTPTSGRHRRKIVIHSMEAPEKGETAENVARYFSRLPASRKASAHYCIDNNSVVQCVQTKDVAYAAPGSNHDGVHLELAGYARQTEAEWLEPYSLAMLQLAAELCGRILVPKFKIPLAFLSEETLRRSPEAPGFTTHAVISRVFLRSSHTDPGSGFPMGKFLGMVEKHVKP
jgi:hypothetical protein